MNRNDKVNYIVVDDLENENITPEKQEELKRNFQKFIEYYFPDSETCTTSFHHRLITTKMKKKIYIAGKVTGEPIAECTMKFGTAQKSIEALGFEAVNPLEVVGDWNAPWNLAMRKCIAALMECDGIIVLPDWLHSTGAKIEFEIALAVSMPDFHFNLHGLEQLSNHKWNN